MRMPWPHASLSRRRAPASAAGLAGGAALPPAGASRAAAAPVRGPARVTAGEYANPAFWQDFAGIDVIRVADTRCASAPTTHHSPGAPVLRPYDPVHWEIAGHAVPVPDFGAKHDPNGGRGCGRGIRASSPACRPSTGTFHRLSRIDFARTYIRTATVTDGPHRARGTLTHRIRGPASTATVQLGHCAMRDGDRAGPALLRDSSTWIGVKREGRATRVVTVGGLTADGNRNTNGTRCEPASADVRPGAARPGAFSHSTDGTTFPRPGPDFPMGDDRRFPTGYRFALFGHATRALGGSVRVTRFEPSTP